MKTVEYSVGYQGQWSGKYKFTMTTYDHFLVFKLAAKHYKRNGHYNNTSWLAGYKLE